jgi:acetyl esterase/lipase
MLRLFAFAALLISFVPNVRAADPNFTRKEDIIYGRKYGTALTFDVFTPNNANGIGVVFAVSGGWFSDHGGINPVFFGELLNRGYTVFAVVHGSQPKFTIPEVLQDMNRAVRFIRFHAKDYKIDPNRIGMIGGSAGGHLSLMQGSAGDDGDPKARNPIDRVSSRVQAVACFFPPTDFLNYGKTGEVALGSGTLKAFKAPFDFHDFDEKTRSFAAVTDEEKRREIGRRISPVYQVTAKSAPTLIVHGDADTLVPIQQAELMIARLKEAGVPAELVVKKGGGHGWADFPKDVKSFADWFDKYLRKRTSAGWERWRFLEGDWVGEGDKGSGEFSFALDLGKNVLVRKNHAELPAAAGRPAGVHDDMMVVYREADEEKAIYFDNEGHVIHYTPFFSADGREVVFLSDPVENGPRFRLTYHQEDGQKVTIKFEIAPPNKPGAFMTYLEGKAHKK